MGVASNAAAGKAFAAEISELRQGKAQDHFWFSAVLESFVRELRGTSCRKSKCPPCPCKMRRDKDGPRRVSCKISLDHY
jgi:hypothetical protein